MLATRWWSDNLPGPGHTASEDAAYVSPPQPGPACCAAVADGVGSSPDGRTAAHAAITEAERCWQCGSPAPAGLAALFGRSAERLAALERADHRLAGLASTLAVLWVAPEAVWTAHLGDSRVYRAGTNGAAALTADDRIEVDGRSLLTAAVTARPGPAPRIARFPPPGAGDVYLLCTDGVWSAADPSELQTALARRPAEAAAWLRTLAARRRDDFCYVLLEVQAAGAPPAPPAPTVDLTGTAVEPPAAAEHRGTRGEEDRGP